MRYAYILLLSTYYVQPKLVFKLHFIMTVEYSFASEVLVFRPRFIAQNMVIAVSS
jgi:hypothetical protein